MIFPVLVIVLFGFQVVWRSNECIQLTGITSLWLRLQSKCFLHSDSAATRCIKFWKWQNCVHAAGDYPPQFSNLTAYSDVINPGLGLDSGRLNVTVLQQPENLDYNFGSNITLVSVDDISGSWLQRTRIWHEVLQEGWDTACCLAGIHNRKCKHLMLPLHLLSHQLNKISNKFWMGTLLCLGSPGQQIWKSMRRLHTDSIC